MSETEERDEALEEVKNDLRAADKGKTKKKAKKAKAKKAKAKKAKPADKKSKKAGKSAKDTAKTPRKRQEISLIDAAVQVLEANKVPMSVLEIFEEISVKKLWKSAGKTPDRTLSSAILRELRLGKKSRFKRAKERGKFLLA